MKIKRLFSAIGLGLFALAAVGAGLVGAKAKKAESVKADDPATWMMNISLEAKDIMGYEGFDPDSMWFHTYTDGVGNDKWFHMYLIDAESDCYQVNATFTDSYTFNRIQFQFKQNSVEKWSESASIGGSKETHYKQIYGYFTGWSGSNWTYYSNVTSNLFIEYKDVEYAFEEDVANERFVASNVVSDASDYYTIYYRSVWTYCADTLTTSARQHFTYVAENWCEMKAGTYDVFLKNNGNDNGVIEIKKHQEAENTKIYYVTGSSSATGDYIYSWGGTSQFGAFPGKSIASLVAAGDARELTGNGVIHFQGNDAKLIYEINVTIGYPTGDLTFMFNNGTESYKSAERALLSEYAYWWTGDANFDAAEAIEFLSLAETKRNSADSYSVCNVSKSDAILLVNLYNSFDSELREIYIDCTTVYTWSDSSKTSESLHTYRKVMEQLSRIAEIALEGSSNPSLLYRNTEFNSQSIIIIVSIGVASISALSLLIVLKKRKQ